MQEKKTRLTNTNTTVINLNQLNNCAWWLVGLSIYICSTLFASLFVKRWMVARMMNFVYLYCEYTLVSLINNDPHDYHRIALKCLMARKFSLSGSFILRRKHDQKAPRERWLCVYILFIMPRIMLYIQA